MIHLALLLVLGCPQRPEPVPIEPTAAEAPSLTSIQARELAQELASPGPPRVAYFWALWCTPCIHEVPLLVELSREHPEVEVLLVGLDGAEHPERGVIPFLERVGALTTGPGRIRAVQVEDVDALEVELAQWPRMVPVTLFVRPDGSIARQMHGSVSAADLEEALPLVVR